MALRSEQEGYHAAKLTIVALVAVIETVIPAHMLDLARERDGHW